MRLTDTTSEPEKVRLKTKIGTVRLVEAWYCCGRDAPAFRLTVYVWGPFLPSYKAWFLAATLDPVNGLRVGSCDHAIEKGHEGTVRSVGSAIEAYLKSNPDWLKAALLCRLDQSRVIHQRFREITKDPNLDATMTFLREAKHWTSNFGERYRGRSAADYSELLKEIMDFGDQLHRTLGRAPANQTITSKAVNGHNGAGVPLAAAAQA